jgi:hypothetical protein
MLLMENGGINKETNEVRCWSGKDEWMVMMTEERCL